MHDVKKHLLYSDFCNIFVGRNRFVADQPLQDDLFFELVQPSSLNYLYRLQPARDFGLTLVNFILLHCSDIDLYHYQISVVFAYRN